MFYLKLNQSSFELQKIKVSDKLVFHSMYHSILFDGTVSGITSENDLIISIKDGVIITSIAENKIKVFVNDKHSYETGLKENLKNLIGVQNFNQKGGIILSLKDDKLYQNVKVEHSWKEITDKSTIYYKDKMWSVKYVGKSNLVLESVSESDKEMIVSATNKQLLNMMNIKFEVNDEI